MNCLNMLWQCLFCTSTVHTLRALEWFLFWMNCFDVLWDIRFNNSTIFKIWALKLFIITLCLFSVRRQIHFRSILMAAVWRNSIGNINMQIRWNLGTKFNFRCIGALNTLLIIVQKYIFRHPFNLNRTLFSRNSPSVFMKIFIIYMRNKLLNFCVEVMIFYLQQKTEWLIEWWIEFKYIFQYLMNRYIGNTQKSLYNSISKTTK